MTPSSWSSTVPGPTTSSIGTQSGQDGHWNIYGDQGKNATAVWSMSKPVSLAAGTTFTFEMQCQTDWDSGENLGHFRLSVSSDPAAIEVQAKLTKLTDPWEKLAAAYQLKGDRQAIDRLVERRPKLAGPVGDLFTQEPNKDWQRAVEIYNKGITPQTTDADLLSKRARAYEALKNWDAAAADWSRAASGNPDGAKLLGEFARRLAAAGQLPLAKAQFDQSEALYARSLREDPENDMVAAELAQLLFDKEENENRTRWTVLKPSEMKSKGGATLSKLPDESILASGKNPLGDAYTIVAPTQVTQVSAIRLEALTHESLPNQGPGRSEQTRGNFAMVNFTITAHIPGTQPRPIEVSRVAADHYFLDLTANHWNIEGGQGRPHTAVYLAKQPVDCKDGTRLEFQMEFYPGADWPLQNLGRFRLSVSSDPAAFDGEQTRFAAMKLTDPWAKLAVAYAVNGRNDEATRYFTRALERSEGREARKPILELAAHFGDLLPALIERQPDEPQLQLALARSLARRGQAAPGREAACEGPGGAGEIPRDSRATPRKIPGAGMDRAEADRTEVGARTNADAAGRRFDTGEWNESGSGHLHPDRPDCRGNRRRTPAGNDPG